MPLFTRIVPTSLLFLALTSCAVESRDSYSQNTADSDLTHADNWESITLFIGGAKTQLFSNGHFTTTPNACYRRESGALNLDLWNRVALAVNRMLQHPWPHEESCSGRPAGSPDLRRPVILQTRDGKTRELLSSTGSQYCTRSTDLPSAADLLVALGEVALKARHEGCQAGLTQL